MPEPEQVDDIALPVERGSRGRFARLRARRLLIGLGVGAFMVRLVPIVTGQGGLRFYGRYDDGVYYAAADALIHGRMPYRNFVLLHPPGVMLALAPFAAFGALTNDPLGMAVARIAFMAVGALNAIFVAVLARRWGRRPAIVAGLIYAGWLSAAYSEQSTLIEPLAGTAILVALLLLLRPDQLSRRSEWLAGAALGIACCMKIWYAAPLITVLICVLLYRRFALLGRLIGGAAIAMTAILLPFFAAAPGRMWNMVVRDQLRRGQPGIGRLHRLSGIVGVKRFLSGHPHAILLLTAAILALIVVAAVACLTDRTARIIVAVLVVNFAVLLASPTYFAHYAALIAAPAALVIGIGLERLAKVSALTALATPATGVLVAISLVSAGYVIATPNGFGFPGSTFARAAPAGCIAADDPAALIQMNRLSTDLAHGCRVPVDVTGITYDSLRRTGPDGAPEPRNLNPAFQAWLANYLLSARAFVLIRQEHDLSPPRITAELDRQPPIVSRGPIVLRRGLGAG